MIIVLCAILIISSILLSWTCTEGTWKVFGDDAEFEASKCLTIPDTSPAPAPARGHSPRPATATAAPARQKRPGPRVCWAIWGCRRRWNCRGCTGAARSRTSGCFRSTTRAATSASPSPSSTASTPRTTTTPSRTCRTASSTRASGC